MRGRQNRVLENGAVNEELRKQTAIFEPREPENRAFPEPDFRLPELCEIGDGNRSAKTGFFLSLSLRRGPGAESPLRTKQPA